MCSRQAPTPNQGEPAPCRTPTPATEPPREANGLLAGWLVVGGRAAAACQGRRLILAPRAALLQRHSARLTTSPVRHLNSPRCLLSSGSLPTPRRATPRRVWERLSPRLRTWLATPPRQPKMPPTGWTSPERRPRLAAPAASCSRKCCRPAEHAPSGVPALAAALSHAGKPFGPAAEATRSGTQLDAWYNTKCVD